MHFIYYIYFVSGPGRSVYGVVAKLADVFYAAVGCAVDFDDVNVLAGVYGNTAIAFQTRLNGWLVSGKAI